MGMSKKRRLLTTKEVAYRLGVNPRTPAVWIRQGKLKAKKVGRVWRVSEEELQKFLGPS